MTASSAVAASPELVRRDDDNGVVTLTLNAPQNRNALSLAMIEALSEALATGSPPTPNGGAPSSSPARVRFFSSGHDLRGELAAHRNDAGRRRQGFLRVADARLCAEMMQAIVALPKPVVAAVEGVATAAGCQLVASCDLAFAARSGGALPCPASISAWFVRRRWWR